MPIIHIEQLYYNTIPTTIIVGLLSTDAYNGALNKNPYHFQHYKVSEMSINYNGKQLPTEKYTPDWDNQLFYREYRQFYDNIGIGTNNLATAITPDLYYRGMTLYSWDLTPDYCNGYHWHKKDSGGTINLLMKFAEGSTDSITVLVFGVFDALVAIDKMQNVEVSM